MQDGKIFQITIILVNFFVKSNSTIMVMKNEEKEGHENTKQKNKYFEVGKYVS